MKKRKLKEPVIYGLYAFGFIFLLGVIYAVESIALNKNYGNNDVDYVNKTIFDEIIPVVNEEKVIAKPYNNDKIKILKDFYDYKDDAKTQEKSLIFYENTYLPNSGISYGGVENFDVLAIYDGVVKSITQDNLLGAIVQIEHENNIISIYQSLSELNVTENQVIKQGDIIGKSGTCNIEKELNNHLHFELIVNGMIVNPEDYYFKKISEI